MAEPGESTLPDTLGTVPRLLEGFGEKKTPESRGQYARNRNACAIPWWSRGRSASQDGCV
jgi:hypothetical protein